MKGKSKRLLLSLLFIPDKLYRELLDSTEVPNKITEHMKIMQRVAMNCMFRKESVPF